VSACAAQNPFIGDWELTVPGNHAGWLGVHEQGGALKAEIMWEAGSVVPVDSAKLEDGKLVLTRKHNFERKDSSGKRVKGSITETITATAQADRIQGTSVKPRENGSGEDRAEFTGKRTPPMPPAPDLKKVKFGETVHLLNGKDLSGWRLTDPNAVNGWSVKDGLLVNNPAQEEGKPHKNYGNLRTDKEFEDFNLQVEVLIDTNQNSGIYLRGIYEVQVAESYGKAPESHEIGGVYSRLTPTANPANPPGQWQKFDITLVDRHVTVILNGKKIIDNQPIAGCTGGALWSDVSRPGPIYIQGDHTGITYRKLDLKPVVGK
jgi:hypothetical protein